MDAERGSLDQELSENAVVPHAAESFLMLLAHVFK
jgi:hypothetical protein